MWGLVVRVSTAGVSIREGVLGSSRYRLSLLDPAPVERSKVGVKGVKGEVKGGCTLKMQLS